MRAAAALFKALAGRFVGSGLLFFLLPGILEGWHVLRLRIQRAARIVEVTVRARQSQPSLQCGHVLGLRMLLDAASRLGADKVLLQMRGYSRRFAAPNACDIDVIRRLAAVRSRAALDGVRGVADMDEDHGVELSVFAFPRIKGVKPQSYGVDAGKRPHIASKAEAEATPRVDVGEVSTTMVSRGERQNKPASFQVFARVDGKTLVVQVWEDMLISDLCALVACRLHASPDQCYVTKGGKLLSLLSSVHEVGLVKGSTVELHARGVGSAVPGEWYCNHCQRGGCWPARSHCFRCGMARNDGGFGKGGKAKGKGGTPPRETSYPGKSSSTAARMQAGKGWSSKPNVENSNFARCCLSVAEPFAELGGFATSYGRNSNEDFASFSKREGSPCSYSSGC